jgi:hypothetical protein
VVNPTFNFANAASGITLNGLGEMTGATYDAGSTSQTVTFTQANAGNGVNWTLIGCDFSKQGANTLVGAAAGSGSMQIDLVNCALGTGTVLAAATTVLNKGNTTVNLYNCANGDNHFACAHYDAFGSTVASATIYATGGAKYDGTNGVSLKISTTPNCSYFTPYVSPWIDKYNAGGVEITPRLECFRDGSTTIYDNTQVWSELSYQGTSGSTKATIVSNRATPLASGSTTGRTSTLTHASWETGTSADVAFKLDHGAVTPAEIGHLRMRVCVGATEVTDLYVDGKVRL